MSAEGLVSFCAALFDGLWMDVRGFNGAVWSFCSG